MNNCEGEVNEDLWNYIKNVLLKICYWGAFVIIDDAKVILAADMVWAHPLFIMQDGNTWVITDVLSKVDEELVVDDKALEMYIACNMVLDNKTVYENVFSVQAGEVLSINGNYIDSERYFEFLQKKKRRVIKIRNRS